jgi:TupA-like ATPgrasp
MAVGADGTIAADIIAELGQLVAAGRWPRHPPPGTMRGVDFYRATDFLAALVLAARQFRHAHGTLPSLTAPASFSEHLFVRKFFAAFAMPSLADKLAARAYVRARLGDAVLPALVWEGDGIDALFAAALPEGRFVLKPNNNSGALLFLQLPDDLARRREEIAARAAMWRASRFGHDWGEWQYSTVAPRLMLEAFLDFNPGAAPDDYKVFCFNGRARMINLHIDRFTPRHRSALYDPAWRKFPVDYGRALATRPRPGNLEALVATAETIARGHEFVRVDLYTDGRRTVKFGEMTFTPGNATDRFSDIAFDRWLGGFLAPGADQRRDMPAFVPTPGGGATPWP